MLDPKDMEHDETTNHEFESARGPKRFPCGELITGTRDFIEERKGGLGSVYKGWLKELRFDVTIKRIISKGSK